MKEEEIKKISFEAAKWDQVFWLPMLMLLTHFLFSFDFGILP